VLYLELATRLGIAHVFGVPLPGRFMVGWKGGPEGELELIDTFNRGKKTTVEQAALELSDRGRFDETELQPAAKRDILLRMLRNLLSSALDDEKAVKESLSYLDLTVAIDPDSSVERITRAQMHQRLGDKAAARVDVQWLIEHFPESGPEEFRSKLDEWMQSLRD
jgi:regulator of sirC expression with transglutaminase-like and TPR domain